MSIHVGKTGGGKSYAGLRICSDLDPAFSAERIVFSVEEFLSLLKNGDSLGKLKTGSAVLFDEIAGSERAADSRSSMSRTNKLLGYLATTMRFRKIFVVFCAPQLSQIDKNIRKIGIKSILNFKRIDFKKKRSIARLHWLNPSPIYSDKLYIPLPRIRDKKTGDVTIIDSVSIPLPPKFLIDAYERKKEKFFQENLNRWLAELKGEKKEGKKVNMKKLFKRACKELPFLLDSKGVVALPKLRLKYGLTQRNSSALRALLIDYIKEKEKTGDTLAQ